MKQSDSELAQVRSRPGPGLRSSVVFLKAPPGTLNDLVYD